MRNRFVLMASAPSLVTLSFSGQTKSSGVSTSNEEESY
jgi:hypothetical protein